ncbi:MAG: rhodanese-like domain-containing protein, partial [Verrucomicrobia bacterium]|nr:rhodanese-like domain-containing protein [Verrucomicrobiota bacterium]
EFNYDGSIKNSLLIPVNQLGKKLTMLEYYKDKKIIVYCKTGRRSKLATAFCRAIRARS